MKSICIQMVIVLIAAMLSGCISTNANVINIARDGMATINGKPAVPRRSCFQTDDGQTMSNVVIRVHPDTPCSNLVEAINLCLALGIHDIALASENGPPTTAYRIYALEPEPLSEEDPEPQVKQPNNSVISLGLYLYVILYSDTGIACPSSRMTEKQLNDKLRILGSLDNEEERQVLLASTSDVPCRRIIRVLQSCREQGIARIYFRGL